MVEKDQDKGNLFSALITDSYINEDLGKNENQHGKHNIHLILLFYFTNMKEK